jgi:ribosome-binding protein aMBF1 (putative translation factor)
MTMNIPQRITLRRKAMGWSKYRLAKESGLSPQVIAFIESGKSAGWEKIVKVLGALSLEIQLKEKAPE